MFARPTAPKEWNEPSLAPGNDYVRLKKTSVQAVGQGFVSISSPIQIICEFWCFVEEISLNVNVILKAEEGECVFNMGSSSAMAQHAIMQLEVIIPPSLLNNQTYSVTLTVVKNHSEHLFEFANCISFEVQDERQGLSYFGAWPGVIRPTLDNELRIKQPLDTAKPINNVVDA
jgi:lipopolysaccharide transport system ATP-binding protein